MASPRAPAALAFVALFSCGSAEAPRAGVALEPRPVAPSSTASPEREAGSGEGPRRRIAENAGFAVDVDARGTSLVERATGRALATTSTRHEDCAFERDDRALCVHATGEPGRGLSVLTADGTARTVAASADEPPSVRGDLVFWLGREGDRSESSVFALDVTTGELARYEQAQSPILELEAARDGLHAALALDDRVVVLTRDGAGFRALEVRAERPEGLMWDATSSAVAWGESDLERVARLRVADAATGRVLELRVPPCAIAVETPTRFADGRLVTDATCSPGCPSLPFEAVERTYRVGRALVRERERRTVTPPTPPEGPFE